MIGVDEWPPPNTCSAYIPKQELIYEVDEDVEGFFCDRVWVTTLIVESDSNELDEFNEFVLTESYREGWCQ